MSTARFSLRLALAIPVLLTLVSRTAGAQNVFEWSTGSMEHYFPTTTGKYSIVDSDDIDPAAFVDGVFYLELEVLATGYWPGQTGFVYGVAGYPLSDPNFHELGARDDEWAYRGRSGETYAEGATSAFGNVLKNIGDRIRIWYDSRTDELSFYTKRSGESEWSLEGGRVAHTGVVPEGGRTLRFVASGICWQPCGVEIVGGGVPPKAVDAGVVLPAGPTYTFAAADFRFDDQGDGDALDHVRVVTLPAAGTLFLDADADAVVDPDEDVGAGTDVSKADLDAGRLKYAPDGTASTDFTFSVADATGLSVPTYTMTIDASQLPVELTGFTVTADGPGVVLRWTTASETNNAGFEVQRRANEWEAVGFVEGRGTTAEVQAYTHRVDGLAPGTYRFRLKQVDYDGTFHYSPEVELTVEAPRVLALEANYPNPFNPTTTIPFTVPADGRAVVAVYDVVGRRVATLFDGVAQAGRRYTVAFEAGRLATGMYVYELRFGGRRVTRTLMLMR